MPLRIERNDIVCVKADVIVNSANPNVFIGGGTDRAIYTAAGEQKLFRARERVGIIDEGEVKYTSAYDLDAKFIFHVVAPNWQDGNNREVKLYESCYRNCLELAKKLECTSVAFPLIGTGILGWPKDAALDIAVTTIQDFLFTEDKEYTITIVVFDNKSFEISKKLHDSVQQFISNEEYWKKYEIEYKNSKKKPIERENVLNRGTFEKESIGSNVFSGYNDLNEVLNATNTSFSEYLFSKIDERGKTEVEVYKRAFVSKKVFSDIRSKTDYHPNKRTAIRFALALKMSFYETKELLEIAGFSLTEARIFDRIIIYCIKHRIYNVIKVDEILITYNQPTLYLKL